TSPRSDQSHPDWSDLPAVIQTNPGFGRIRRGSPWFAVVRVRTNHHTRGSCPHEPPYPWFVSARTTPPWFVSARTTIPTVRVRTPHPAVVRVRTNHHTRGACPHEPPYPWFVSARTTNAISPDQRNIPLETDRLARIARRLDHIHIHIRIQLPPVERPVPALILAVHLHVVLLKQQLPPTAVYPEVIQVIDPLTTREKEIIDPVPVRRKRIGDEQLASVAEHH